MSKATALTRINARLLGVKGAHQALSAIDYDRFSLNKLTAKIVLYVANKDHLASSFTAHYDGLPRLLGQQIILPSLTYQYHQVQYLPGEIPLGIIQGTRPGRLEFSMIATPDDYPQIKAFMKEVIPTFFRAGYTYTNPDHFSIAWLHVGRVDSMETTVLSMQPDGLHLGDIILSDGSHILTERDIDILKDLQMRE